MRTDALAEALREILPDADIRVVARPDRMEIVVVSATFSGRSLAERARCVYTALGTACDEPLPALLMRLRAPEESGKNDAAQENRS